MTTSLLALLLILGASGQSPGSEAAPAAGETARDAAAAAPEEKSRIKCKSYRPSGTRFDKRVCRTISDWERHREESREAMREIQARPQFCMPGNTACTD